MWKVKKDWIDQLLLKRIPLAGMARVAGVSERWLPGDVNRKYQEVPQQINFKKSLKESGSSHVMSWGLLLEIKIINHGFGGLLIKVPVNSSGFLSVIGVRKVLKDFGILYLPFIVNIPFSIPIFGKLIG